MLDTQIQVKTDIFDGPLSLLLLLVQKDEMDIKKLDLTVITKQYLTYLSQMRELNFDVAGDYLYLAATLLLLKSNTCISEEEQEGLKANFESGDLNITSHAELVRRLEELKHFQKMSEKIWALPKMGEDTFVKPKVNKKQIIDSILTPIDLSTLTMAMIDFIRKDNRKFTVVTKDRLSIKEKLTTLKTHLKNGDSTNFESILNLDGERTADNVVITFISLLELARLKKLEIFQNEADSEIYIKVVDSLENFDVSMADGFEPEEDESATDKDVIVDEQGQSLMPSVANLDDDPIATRLDPTLQ